MAPSEMFGSFAASLYVANKRELMKVPMSSQARARKLAGGYVLLANAHVHVYAASVGSQKECTVERTKETSNTKFCGITLVQKQSSRHNCSCLISGLQSLQIYMIFQHVNPSL